MKPANYPITIFPGRKFTLQIRLLDTLGDRIDLTGYSVAVDVKTEPGGDLIIALDTALTDPTEGLITISKAHGSTAGLTPQRGVWDIMLTNASSEKLPPYVGGPAEIRNPVTD